MAKNTFQLNFDELASITKIFKDEGEDIARLHSSTRQRVRDMHKEWIGEAADKFFEEMETELLPALQRLTQALIHSQDVTNEIMKIIRDADEETAGYFRDQLSGDDFGAARFGAILEGLRGGRPDADDFGAGKFGEALGSLSGGGSSSSPAGSGSGNFGEASGGTSEGGGQSAGEQGGGSQQSEKEGMETESTPAGGGGGGGSESSQGLQGDLKKMGAGLAGQVPQTASAGGGSGPNMPDHIYSSGGSPGPAGQSQPETGGGSSASGEQPSTKEGAGAAGAAGVAGAAAAGGAAKVVKDKQKKSE